MTSGERTGEPADIIRLVQTYHRAMVDARTPDLDRMVDANFSLGHITGYVQPKDEWFGVIRSGEFDYHRITVDENALSTDVMGGTAVVRGLGIFDATINGIRNSWRLQFTMDLRKRDGRWIIMRARYSTF